MPDRPAQDAKKEYVVLTLRPAKFFTNDELRVETEIEETGSEESAVSVAPTGRTLDCKADTPIVGGCS